MALDKMLKRPYAIEPYNPAWAEQFLSIRKDIEQAFGTKALSITHIGSTSVPGLSAKPVIDVMVVVERMETFADEKASMVAPGYQWEENYTNQDTLLFYKEKSDHEKIVNIHVCVAGSADEEKFPLLATYLKAHPERAKEYDELKMDLYAQFPNDYPSYREGKQAFIEETKVLAREEKKSKDIAS